MALVGPGNVTNRTLDNRVWCVLLTGEFNQSAASLSGAAAVSGGIVKLRPDEARIYLSDGTARLATASEITLAQSGIVAGGISGTAAPLGSTGIPTYSPTSQDAALAAAVAKQGVSPTGFYPVAATGQTVFVLPTSPKNNASIVFTVDGTPYTAANGDFSVSTVTMAADNGYVTASTVITGAVGGGNIESVTTITWLNALVLGPLNEISITY